jgi:Zn-dependent peptidase ImmA (M78 family)
LRGAYINDDCGATVMLAKGLPEDPTVFTMGHELKHHLADRELSLSYCDASNASNPIEIGAEIFAAELIYPDDDFREHLKLMGVLPGKCTAEHLVELKHDTRTTLSYAGLAKRAEFMNFAVRGSLAQVRWKKLEEQLYGPPIYKRIRRRY